MHNYSLFDKKAKIIPIAIIGMISIYLSSFMNLIFSELTILKFIYPISALTIFGVLFFLFDRFFFILQLNKLFNVPHFGGNWKGDYNSSFNQEKGDVKLTISQTFSNISISAIFGKSKSQSISASIDENWADTPKLTYIYENEPDAYGNKTLAPHKGVVELCLNEKNKIEGNYFTNRTPKSTRGKLKLKKIK